MPLLNLPFGWIGVNVFFVLSGFLITRILVFEKDKPFKSFVSRFYLNRSLRIFPIYYLFILGLVCVFVLIPIFFPDSAFSQNFQKSSNEIKSNIWFVISYTYNYIFLSDPLGNWIGNESVYTGPFWTLSIEEQFYLVFPFVVFFSSVKNLKKIILAIIICSPFFRFLWAFFGKQYFDFQYENYLLGEQIYKFTFLQADSLAMGAALAVFKFDWIKKVNWWFFLCLILVVGAGIFNLYILKSSGSKLPWKTLGYEYPGHWLVNTCNWGFVNLRYVYNYSIINLMAALLILAVSKSEIKFGFLNNAFILYLGQISYGIYVYHQAFLHFFSEWICPNFLFFTDSIFPLGKECFLFTVYFSLIVLIAHLSFKYIEAPFLKLKVHH